MNRQGLEQKRPQLLYSSQPKQQNHQDIYVKPSSIFNQRQTVQREDEDGITLKPLEVNVSVSSLKNINTTQTTTKHGKVVQKIQILDPKGPIVRTVDQVSPANRNDNQACAQRPGT